MKTALLLLTMIGSTVAANLLMKLGAHDRPSAILLGLFSLRTAMGLSFFGFAALNYAWVLRLLPLNVAQSMAAAQFICVILASRIILMEPISPMRWVGIGLIGIGIAVVVYSMDQA